jgi:hypothetical protein
MLGRWLGLSSALRYWRRWQQLCYTVGVALLTIDYERLIEFIKPFFQRFAIFHVV